MRQALLLPFCALALAAPSVALQSCDWSPEADLPTPRLEGPAVEIDGRMYIFGGFAASLTAVMDLDVFDPVSQIWTTAADLPTAVTHIGLARDDRQVWLAGGFVGDHPGAATDEVWVYDVDLDQWSAGPSLPKQVASGVLARVGRNLHWFGGVEADRNTNSADHWVLDLDQPSNGWSSLAPMPEPRCHLGGAVLGGRIHAIGGQYRHDYNPHDLDLHHVYDPQTDTWSPAALLPTPRSHFESATVVVDDDAVIVGGRNNVAGQAALFDVSRYDPTLDVWAAMPSLPERSLGPSAEIVGDRIYVTGGSDPALVPHAETWSIDKDATFGSGGHLRINCGGPPYTSASQESWCQDLGFVAGEAFENPNVADVAGTDDDELYRTYRSGPIGNPNLHYSFPTGPGKYRLRLHFAEILHGATGYGGPSVGERVLRFVIEGGGVKNGYDVAKVVGVETATTLTFDFATTDGVVNLAVIAVVGDPMLAALELIALPDDAFELFCDSPANSLGASAEIVFKGSGSLAGNDLRLYASPVPAGFGLYFYGAIETDVPFGNGRRCVDAPVFRLGARAVTNQTLAETIPLSNPPPNGQILAGSTWLFQAWYRDPAAGGAAFNSSNALRMSFTD